MTVQELINVLNKIGDKNLEIKIENPNGIIVYQFDTYRYLQKKF